MGVEVVLIRSDEPECRLIDRNGLCKAFGIDIQEQDDGDLRLVYGNEVNSCHVRFNKSSPRLQYVMIDRAVREPALWSAVFLIMEEFDYFLYWSYGSIPLIARPGVQVPNELRERYGPPKLITRFEEILEQPA